MAKSYKNTTQATSLTDVKTQLLLDEVFNRLKEIRLTLKNEDRIKVTEVFGKDTTTFFISPNNHRHADFLEIYLGILNVPVIIVDLVLAGDLEPVKLPFFTAKSFNEFLSLNKLDFDYTLFLRVLDGTTSSHYEKISIPEAELIDDTGGCSGTGNYYHYSQKSGLRYL